MDKDFLDVLRLMLVSGKSQDEIFDCMVSEGVEIMDAIILVRSLYGVNLGVAKEIVSQNYRWNSSHLGNKNLHDELENFVKKEKGD
ncbi:hypothetical protein C0Q88_22615 [Ralstonia pickettii]|uniref:Uncharacterized protein n=1 Tax=Ralstonia pickettii TaxID=329 RepID=A0A2N4TLL4_RALPI|nr:hypothetical protein [Ralstonia pickettii]PLC40592.1 hypothetical protein C0Q88_22615 [Ralstonia pickettii]